MTIQGMKSADTRNWKQWVDKIFPWTYDAAVAVGQKMEVTWVDIQNVESRKDDLRLQGFDKGAARFARGEGMWYSDNTIYFICTNGGYRKKGQVWRYIPSPFEGTSAEDKQPGILEIFIEPNNSDLLENGDNMTVTPWGDLILCEDGPGTQFLVGVTPEGKLYRFAKNSRSTSEFAGATFSLDGSTLFVNIQGAGIDSRYHGYLARIHKGIKRILHKKAKGTLKFCNISRLYFWALVGEIKKFGMKSFCPPSQISSYRPQVKMP